MFDDGTGVEDDGEEQMAAFMNATGLGDDEDMDFDGDGGDGA